MFLRRRRPLLGAAMLGGAVMAGRASQRAQYHERDQDARIVSIGLLAADELEEHVTQ